MPPKIHALTPLHGVVPSKPFPQPVVKQADSAKPPSPLQIPAGGHLMRLRPAGSIDVTSRTRGLRTPSAAAVNEIAPFLDTRSLANWSVANKPLTIHLNNHEPRMKGLAAARQFEKTRDILEQKQWKAARALFWSRRICFRWVLLPLNLATFFIPSILITRHFKARCQAAQQAVEAHQLTLPAISPPKEPLTAASRKRAIDILTECRRRENLNNEKTKLEGYSRDCKKYLLEHGLEDLMDKLTLSVFSAGVFPLAFCIGWAYCVIRPKLIDSEIRDMGKMIGTTEQQQRAAVSLVLHSGAQQVATEHMQLQRLKSAETALLAGNFLNFSPVEARELLNPSDVSFEEELCNPTSGEAYRLALDKCYGHVANNILYRLATQIDPDTGRAGYRIW